jgi:ComF family protein
MARAAALYEEPIRSAIHALKYDHSPQLAPLLARYLVAALDHSEWAAVLPLLSAICPVPLHAARLAQRGYNQSALLAESLGSTLGFPIETTWLERKRDTPPQVGLTAAQRSVNVADSFAASPNAAGHVILLVDDVFTTGATLRACAEAARTAGAREVYAVTLARPLLQPGDGAI